MATGDFASDRRALQRLIYSDQATGISIPIDLIPFRGITSADSIPVSAPGPQTAAMGSSYLGTPTFPLSPDSPAKSPADDTSYSAPSGGVLATLSTQVVGNQSGQPSLFLNLDDGSPNSPGSGIAFFDGTTSQQLLLSSSQLGDGYHGEGATCVPTTTSPTGWGATT